MKRALVFLLVLVVVAARWPAAGGGRGPRPNRPPSFWWTAAWRPAAPKPLWRRWAARPQPEEERGAGRLGEHRGRGGDDRLRVWRADRRAARERGRRGRGRAGAGRSWTRGCSRPRWPRPRRRWPLAQANLANVKAGTHPAEILAAQAALRQAIAERDAAETAWQDVQAILDNPQEIEAQIVQAQAAGGPGRGADRAGRGPGGVGRGGARPIPRPGLDGGEAAVRDPRLSGRGSAGGPGGGAGEQAGRPRERWRRSRPCATIRWPSSARCTWPRRSTTLPRRG